MTLFKKVFASHVHGEATTPVAFQKLELQEADIVVGEEIVTGIAAAIGDQKAETSPNRQWNDDTSDAPPKPLGEMEAPPSGGLHSVPQSHQESECVQKVETSMAERAAQAQIEIENSRKRLAAERVKRVEDSSTAETRTDNLRAETPKPTDRDASVTADDSGETTLPMASARPDLNVRRVRTRMLGFDQGIDAAIDPFGNQKADGITPARMYPVGWLVVVAGPGKGNSFPIFNGVSTIGRGTDQSIVLDFGDTSISREKHAALAYDDENHKFFLGHGGKSNIVRLNGRPVLSTENLIHEDTVRIGETTLRFIALCGSKFAWGTSRNDEM